MSSGSLVLDSTGPFVNDRFVNSFTNAGTAGLTPGTVVKITGAQQVNYCSQTTENALGVVWNATPPGALVGVVTRGIVNVASDNSTNAGDLMTAGASGQMHSIGSSLSVGGSGSTVAFVRGIALATQASAGTPLLVALF